MTSIPSGRGGTVRGVSGGTACAGLSAGQSGGWVARVIAIPLAALLLVWPAVWNGYPIVFADTGTYLSQAIHRYAGWDRPVFYSLFLFPLHATVSIWPVVAAQALITVYILHLVCRVLVPALPPAWFVVLVAGLSACTWLPFLVSEVMPDLFTPLLILLLVSLVWPPDGMSRVERRCLVVLAAFMIAAQLSSLPLSCAVLAVLAGLAWWRGDFRISRLAPAMLAPVLAVAALCSVNLAAHGRFAVSPFGNIFLLARVIYDGPGLAVLRRDCPAQNWRLCRYLDRLPDNSDAFLWDPDSPLTLAGGAKIVSGDAGAIIAAALRADPAGELQAMARNTGEQLGRFESGDGLEAWPVQVEPWIERDFPARELAAYRAGRQAKGTLILSPDLIALHRLSALAGVAACLIALPGLYRRRSVAFAFIAVVLVTLPVSAAITGALSAPHERYQSRIMWLPPFVAIVGLASTRRRGA